MTQFIMARQNGRTIPKEDKIFGISRQAKEMIQERGKDAVVNATIGSLLDDGGNLVVLDNVVEALKNLSPVDYADYAPIGGLPGFREAVKRAAFGSYRPKSFTEAVATPGGTGAIRSAISNYSEPGDRVLTSDWFWAPYGTIAQELGRKLETYPLFDEKGAFNAAGFAERVRGLLKDQDRLVILLNTPAHNPTGYSLSDRDWENVLAVLKEEARSGSGKGIVLFVDVAYIDFAGDPETCRSFLPLLDDLPETVLPVIGYSASKTFTMYGMRCGAMICMARTEAVAAEFRQVAEFSARGTWSNCTRASQTVLAEIYSREDFLKRVDEERAVYREMLIRRGKAFEEASRAAGLAIVPFDAGFFTSVPCAQPDAAAEILKKEGIFVVPLAKGLRVSVASIDEKKCAALPARIRAAVEEAGKG